MNNHVTSSALVGVVPQPVRVETSLSGGRGQFIIVGLPDAAVRESRERVRSALKRSGFRFPTGRVVVSLSPADLPKSGALFDLPIALSIVQATDGLGDQPTSFVASGELSLSGDLKRTSDSIVAACVARDCDAIALVPSGSTVPTALSGHAVAVSDLRQAVNVIRGTEAGHALSAVADSRPSGLDMEHVKGQSRARRALEIAAAGGHHMLMVGPPGAGKSMLASTLPTLLPRLDDRESTEVALVRAARGAATGARSFPPFRAPHHSITMAALVGGGSGMPTPGEITLAHHGVLFLDELGEFPPTVLDALRQPMESGFVVVSRQGASIRFPSSIQVVAASNPCPCGYRGDRKRGCTCVGARLDRYQARLSGPLLDRFDVRITVSSARLGDLDGPKGETSHTVRRRVATARDLQATRNGLNRSLTGTDLDDLEDRRSAARFLATEPATEELTARGWNRIRRVARTIADLAGETLTTEVQLKEALDMRGDIS